MKKQIAVFGGLSVAAGWNEWFLPVMSDHEFGGKWGWGRVSVDSKKMNHITYADIFIITRSKVNEYAEVVVLLISNPRDSFIYNSANIEMYSKNDWGLRPVVPPGQKGSLYVYHFIFH